MVVPASGWTHVDTRWVPRNKTFPKTSIITLPRSLQDHHTSNAKECVQATQKLLDLECSLRRGR